MLPPFSGTAQPSARSCRAAYLLVLLMGHPSNQGPAMIHLLNTPCCSLVQSWHFGRTHVPHLFWWGLVELL